MFEQEQKDRIEQDVEELKDKLDKRIYEAHHTKKEKEELAKQLADLHVQLRALLPLQGMIEELDIADMKAEIENHVQTWRDDSASVR
jgi:hypothetical protein